MMKQILLRFHFCKSKLGLLAATPWVVLGLSSCNSGGGITAAPSTASVVEPQVSNPTIAFPTQSPYYSKNEKIDIIGMCQSGSKVQLSGDATDYTTCVGSQFQFSVSKKSDGIYSFLVTQSTTDKNTSSPAMVVWNRKSSIAPPAITSPSLSPFKSAMPSLTITGSCETGALIEIKGDGAGTTVCNQSSFALTLPKFVDGDFQLQITQTDLAGNSGSAHMIWKKHALLVTPNNPTLVVKSVQNLTITGGSETYSLSLKTNASGAVLDADHLIYTAGSLANVTDIISVVDSLGSKVDVPVITVPGAPDHFALPNPNLNPVTEIIDTLPTKKVQARVVDRYGNGIALYPVHFEMLVGDAEILSSPLQISTLTGLVEVSIKMGHSHLINTLLINPSTGVLPDVATTGKAKLQISVNAQAKGKGSLGSTFLVGPNPSKIIYADFNGDSKKDMAVLSGGDPSVGILLGKGNGLFGAMNKIRPICDGPSDMVVGDLDMDGKQDLLVLCSGSDTYSVLRGYGDGLFKPAINTSTGPNESQPSAAQLADLNGDGKLDLILISTAGSVAAIRWGLGTGYFDVPTEINTGIAPSSLLLADINKDNKLDLVLTNVGDNSLYYYINQGNGVFGTPALLDTGTTPVAIQSGDFNGDGYTDIAVVNNGSNELSIYLNDTLGGLNAPDSIPTGTNPTSLTVLDLNTDGKKDIVVTNSADNTISVLYGSGLGTFANQGDMTVTTNPVYVMSDNVNGDAYPDLFITGSGNQVVQIIPGQANGVLGFITATGINPSGINTFDYDGDGSQDLLITHFTSNSVGIYKGDGKGFFVSTLNLTTSAGPVHVLAKDLRNSGRKDLLVVNKTGGNFQVFLNDGQGGFEPPVINSSGLNPTDAITADFNGDGFLDVAVSNNGNNKVAIFLGLGDGTFQNPISYATGAGPTQIVLGDFNSDLIVDLISVNSSAGTVSFLAGNGDGTFRSNVDSSCGSGADSLVTGDFNGDGLPDLAVTNGPSSILSVMLGMGDGSFSAPNGFAAGNYTSNIISGDFDGDGKTDLAVSNGSDSTFTLLFGTGTGDFYNSTTFPTHSLTGKIFVSDINKDGALDVMVLDTGNNLVSTWLGH